MSPFFTRKDEVMNDAFTRTQLLIGTSALAHLHHKHIAIFGIGGVGGHCIEAIARCGVGHITLIDNDTISESNINRQLIATYHTIGKLKVEVMKEHLLSINPELIIDIYPLFISNETIDEIAFDSFDYVIDAIDTISAKLLIIERCHQRHIPIISCMGTGNHLDPTRFKITDITKTSYCPVAKVMRRELKQRHINHLTVLYHQDPPHCEIKAMDPERPNRMIPSSIAFVPSVAGLFIASHVIHDLIQSTTS